MRTIFLSLLALLSMATFAQQQPTCNPYPKTITVTGSAEMNIVPDEIYVNVTLREYQKKGEDKIDLEKIKSTFLQHYASVGIADSLISVASYTGFSDYYFTKKRKKRTQDMMADIQYQLKFKNTLKMDELIEKLDDDATQGFYIERTGHSKMTEYRRQLKIKAIQAAKEKGQYLTEAINEKLGVAIKIVEPVEYNSDISQNRLSGANSNLYSNVKSNYDGYDKNVTGVDFKKIKIRFEVEVLFALQ
jgi:uncharacterized protein